MDQIRSKKQFDLRSTSARFQLERFFPRQRTYIRTNLSFKIAAHMRLQHKTAAKMVEAMTYNQQAASMRDLENIFVPSMNKLFSLQTI